MDEKAQKVSALSPLISDSVWATNESTRDWKVIGSAAIGRARARSIVGDVGLGKTIAQSEEALAEKKNTSVWKTEESFGFGRFQSSPKARTRRKERAV